MCWLFKYWNGESQPISQIFMNGLSLLMASVFVTPTHVWNVKVSYVHFTKTTVRVNWLLKNN